MQVIKEADTIPHKAIAVPPQFAIELCERVEAHKNLKPIWWCSYSFLFDDNNEKEISEFLNYCIGVVKRELNTFVTIRGRTATCKA